MQTDTAIDSSALDAIRALQQPGADNLLHRIIRLFLDEGRKLREQIGQALKAADPAAVRAAAHSLKSSSANVGAVRVSEISRELEAAGRASDLAGAAQKFDDLVAAFDAAGTELERVLEDGA